MMEEMPHWFDITVLSWTGARQASIPFSRVPPSSFEGAARGPYKSG
jgi:S-adenosylmethionine:diacylglycerol 3-amino-3-carboxypropyl transferase